MLFKDNRVKSRWGVEIIEDDIKWACTFDELNLKHYRGMSRFCAWYYDTFPLLIEQVKMLKEIKSTSEIPIFMLPLHLTEVVSGDFAKQACGSQSSLTDFKMNMRRNTSHAHLQVGIDEEFTVGEWMKQDDFTETLVFDLRDPEERKVAKQFPGTDFFKTQLDVC